MQRRLKERLIGAAVLVMLAVIFIPMILDDTKHTESTITKSNIPAKPDTDFSSRIVPLEDTKEPAGDTGTDAEESVPPAASETESAAAETVPAETSPAPVKSGQEEAVTSSQEAATSSQPAAATTTEKSGKNSVSGKGDIGLTAWVVQLGSFASEKNANNLNDDLHKAGFSSFVEPVKQGGNVIYRVRVGPELQRSDAQALKDRLRKDMKLDGMILAYP